MRLGVPIAVVILSHNEAANLPRCIDAVRACGEVLVVDDGSTDDSRRIAAAAGARVLEHPFRSFADQRNWAMASGALRWDWVLHLDADEVMTEAGLAELARRLPGMGAERVGCVARKVLLDGRWLRWSADYPVHVPRLVHRDGPRFVMRGHGEVIDMPPGAAVYLDEPLLHYAFSKGWEDWRERHERYAEAEARRILAGLPPLRIGALWSRDRTQRRGALRALAWRLPGRPWLRFCYAYGFRLGFLDGRAGLTFCRAMARYERMIDRRVRTLGDGV